MRESSTALILLRCLQLGLSLSDLEDLTLGMVYDILIEHDNDSYDWEELPTVEDIANF